MRARPFTMRHKPNSRTGVRTDPGDRQSVAGPSGPGEIGARSRNRDPTRPFRVVPVKLAGPGVFDDFPQIIPVSQRELEVIETYLNALLDGVLGRPE